MKGGKFTLMLFLIAIAFISGCAQEDVETTQVQTAFIGGTSGLVASFVPQSPPDEVFEGSGFDIAVKVENIGEYDVPAGEAEVFLGGISSVAFGLDKISDVNTGDLTAAAKIQDTQIPGGVEHYEFESAGAPDFPGDQQFTVIAKMCYPYRTKAVSTACIRPDLFQQVTGTTELCTTSGPKQTASSGAPIAVTSVEQIPLQRQKLGFSIVIKNLGLGTPYIGVEDCRELTFRDINKVQISKLSLPSVGDIDPVEACSQNGDYTLVNNEATAFCTINIGEEVIGEFEDVLNVELDYSYTEQISRLFTVRNVPL
jgi:hypothetical protein